MSLPIRSVFTVDSFQLWAEKFFQKRAHYFHSKVAHAGVGDGCVRRPSVAGTALGAVASGQSCRFPPLAGLTR